MQIPGGLCCAKGSEAGAQEFHIPPRRMASEGQGTPPRAPHGGSSTRATSYSWKPPPVYHRLVKSRRRSLAHLLRIFSPEDCFCDVPDGILRRFTKRYLNSLGWIFWNFFELVRKVVPDLGATGSSYVPRETRHKTNPTQRAQPQQPPPASPQEKNNCSEDSGFQTTAVTARKVKAQAHLQTIQILFSPVFPWFLF